MDSSLLKLYEKARKISPLCCCAMPLIKPKSCSMTRRHGRPAWRHMVFRYNEDKERLLKERNQQRRIEA